MKYKNYKNLFEKIKKISKKAFYANLLNEAKDSAKKTWDIMKEIIGKKKTTTNVLPKELSVND